MVESTTEALYIVVHPGQTTPRACPTSTKIESPNLPKKPTDHPTHRALSACVRSSGTNLWKIRLVFWLSLGLSATGVRSISESYYSALWCYNKSNLPLATGDQFFFFSCGNNNGKIFKDSWMRIEAVGPVSCYSFPPQQVAPNNRTRERRTLDCLTSQKNLWTERLFDFLIDSICGNVQPFSSLSLSLILLEAIFSCPQVKAPEEAGVTDTGTIPRNKGAPCYPACRSTTLPR